MHHRSIEVYHEAIARGEKPIMMMEQQKPKKLRSVSNEIIAGLEKGFVDLHRLTSLDTRLEELRILLCIWRKNGLMYEENDLYHLTADGEFWYVSMTQSMVECAEILMCA